MKNTSSTPCASVARRVAAGTVLILLLAALLAGFLLCSISRADQTQHLTLIYEIQYATIPGGDSTYPSPRVGQVVSTAGTTCAVLQQGYFITEDAGPWHGLYVFVGTSGSKPAQGTDVQIEDTVDEYQGSTEFAYPTSVVEIGPGPDVCQPTVVTAAEAPYDNSALTEKYESVIIEYRDITITSVGTYAALFTDASGSQGAISLRSSYSYVPPGLAVGKRYEYVRGPLLTYYTEYRLYVPSANDIKEIDLTPPTVIATDPTSGATGVSPHKPIDATFDKALRDLTVNPSTFLLAGPGGVGVSGAVAYDNTAYSASFTPDGALSPSTHYTATLTTGIQDASGNALAAPYVWSFTTGDLDTTQPSVVGRFPDVGAVDIPLGASIVVTFSEELNPATVVAANLTLDGPYGMVPWDAVTYDEATYRATLNPRGLLLPTSHYTVTIAEGVTDWAGNPVVETDRTWSFTTQVEPEMVAFHGDLHNHTSYSDGSGMPEEAFSSAVDCGLDFLAVTDHSYAISDAEWQDVLDRAVAATVDGSFVGLRGFEYTQGAEGHANVYNTVRHATRSQVAGCTYCDYTPNLEPGVTVQGFYPWVAVTGTQALDGAGTVLQFNHPGWINFNDWIYHPEVEDVAELEEVGNGWDTSYTFSWEQWIRSLDYGWHVGATNNSDNHAVNWGCISPHRTGLVMSALTKDHLLEALRARRTFATEDSDYDLFFKANGYWMGSELPNTGEIAFEVWGNDPGGELTTLVQLYTVQGQVIAELEPGAQSFEWNLTQDIAPGVHHYFVLVVQEDGDRIVSSPVWTMGDQDVRLTDLTIQPSIPTIYNPSLLTARVTNRGSTPQSMTVKFSVNGVPLDQVPVTVGSCTTGPCEDGYATLSWQPTVTGPVTITATVDSAPAGDNPDDNSRALDLVVTDEEIPLILIDAGHGNVSVDPNGLPQFVGDMTAHGYNVLFNLDEIDASDLNTKVVKLLILNAYGPSQLTTAEMVAIGNFVVNGGNLWLNGLSDYSGSVSWAYNLADRMNALVTSIETTAGQNIPIRFNDDEVLDGDDNNGYPWGVLWHSYPVSMTTGVGVNVLKMQSWSVCSLVDRSKQALTQADLGASGFLMVAGDLDPGTGTYGEANRTHNTDADNAGDAYLYPNGTLLPAAAGYDLPGLAGRLFFYGDSNDPFNIFAYVAGDGKQNELFNLEVVMWLLGQPLQKQTIAQARSGGDTPANLDRLVWVEGFVTASYGEFFDVLYAQDDSGGITVFAPAGTASGAVEPVFERGDCVRIVGTVDLYQGDTELQFFETEQIHVLQPGCIPSSDLSLSGSVPRHLSTRGAALEENEGWLVVVAGMVTVKAGSDSIWIDGGSGPVRAFLDGYNGTWADVSVGDWVRVAGLASEDGLGPRLRVRNHGMHPLLPDDLQFIAPLQYIHLPVIFRGHPDPGP